MPRMADAHLRRQGTILIENVRRRLARLQRSHDDRRADDVHQLLGFERPLAQLQERMRRYATFDERHERRSERSRRFGRRDGRGAEGRRSPSSLLRQLKRIAQSRRVLDSMTARNHALLQRTAVLIAQSVTRIRNSR